MHPARRIARYNCHSIRRKSTAIKLTFSAETSNLFTCEQIPDFQGSIPEAEIAVLPSGAIATACYRGTMTRESFQFPACLGVPDFQGFIPYEAEIAV
jgi:hypothetical protein